MKLHEFTNDLRRDIDRFEAYWKQRHRSEPEQFPLEFESDDAGAWQEQFIAWMESTTD